ncbi:peptidase S8, partial [Amycolatopsis mediterranei]
PQPSRGSWPPDGGRWGVLDAYAAVSSTLPADVAPPGARPPAASSPMVVPAAAPPPRPTDIPAGTIALAGVALAAAAGVTVAAVRRARRRAWRPTRFTR